MLLTCTVQFGSFSYTSHRYVYLSRIPTDLRPEDLQTSLLKALLPAVQDLSTSHSSAQSIWAETQTSSYAAAIKSLQACMDGYDSAVQHVKVHAKPKAKAKTNPKAKAKGKA